MCGNDGRPGDRELGLHRIEVNVRPENDRSRVCAASWGCAGGLKLRYMSIAGQWVDHVAYATMRRICLRGLVAHVWGTPAV